MILKSIRHTEKRNGCKSMYATVCLEFLLRHTFIELRSHEIPRNCSTHGKKCFKWGFFWSQTWASRNPTTKRPEKSQRRVKYENTILLRPSFTTVVRIRHFPPRPPSQRQNNACESCIIHKPKQHWYKFLLLPTTAQQFFLLLHVSATHRSHHQRLTFHRHAQRTVCQWMVICTLIIYSSSCYIVPINL
jgi:hypothetical protein